MIGVQVHGGDLLGHVLPHHLLELNRVDGAAVARGAANEEVVLLAPPALHLRLAALELVRQAIPVKCSRKKVMKGKLD